MSNYTKTTDFSAKDDLPSGDPDKVVVGAEIDAEFDAIATAVATKAEAADVPTLSASNTFTGNANTVSANPANWYWNDTGAGANGGKWRIGATGGQWLFQSRSDDNSTGVTWLAVSRSGTTVTTVSFTPSSTFSVAPAGGTGSVSIGASGAVTFVNSPVTASIGYSVTPTLQFGTSSNHAVDLLTNGTTRLTVRADGPFKTQTFTVATLPSAGTVGTGARSFVTDANATTFASIVAGGGSNQLPVYSDGTNWRIG